MTISESSRVKVKAQFRIIATGELVEEEITINAKDDLFEAYKQVVEDYNRVERERKSEIPDYIVDLREAIKIVEIVETQAVNCFFTKISSVSLEDSQGIYDKVKCLKCGRIRKRYGLISPQIYCKVQEKGAVKKKNPNLARCKRCSHSWANHDNENADGWACSKCNCPCFESKEEGKN
jgi:hypothetical protein